MAMDKYGVSSVTDLQKQELETVRGRLRELRSSHEKTAAETQEVERLETRESELLLELQSA